MSDEFVLRLVLVGGVAVLAVVAALVLRHGTSIRRHRIHLAGLGPGVVFFSSRTCAACAAMRDRLGADVTEIDASSVSFPPAVDRVPAVAVLDGSGDGWIAYGLVGTRRLARWVAGGP